MLTRPWEGTAIVAIYALGALIGILSMLVGNPFGPEVPAAARGMALVFMVPFLLIGLVFCWGVWVGKKWAVIVLAIFSVLGFLGSLTAFNLLNLVVNGFCLWLLYQCYIHPFYNQAA